MDDMEEKKEEHFEEKAKCRYCGLQDMKSITPTLAQCVFCKMIESVEKKGE